MRCPGCGLEAPSDHAFCAGCGAPLSDIPLGLEHDAARPYEADTETTLDLVVRNLGKAAVIQGHVEASFRDQVLGREFPSVVAPGGRLELTLAGARAPKGVSALLVVVSVAGLREGRKPFACRGEFRARVEIPREKTKVRIVNIRGDKNIVDQAKFGTETAEPAPEPARWTPIPLTADAARLRDFIPPGTPLLVRDATSEVALALGDGPIRFGRKRETNHVVVRVPGDEQGSVERISRNHFTLALRGGRLVLGDLSKGGTFLNGARAGEGASPREGDRIQIPGAAEYGLSLDRADGCVSRVVLNRLR
jgi:hypothetical protein